ncbi:MAG: glycoside hydrolase family 20 zincin-like fold domain-containing protein [candidate division KSB1 bacterium]|jgi:hypothetical protein|nr:glycoside hydrolase family 20 zincin-like fold domain-containing protein [candidate division KSB1 bacterium]
MPRKLKLFITVSILLICAGCSQRKDAAQLNLIPNPQSLVLTGDVFNFPDTMRCQTNGFEEDQESIVFDILREALEKRKPDIAWSQKDSAYHIRFSLKSLNDKSWPGDKLGSDGYILRIEPQQIQVDASTSAGLFYGSQTLKQIIAANGTKNGIPCCEIMDWPDFRYRGWQDDVSRGPIPTMDYLKREIRTLASYKMNCMTLYTEDIFKLHKHPGIAPPDGINAEEIRELESYAKRYHVEIIGNFQSFGHMSKILRKPEYAHLGERRSELSPAKAQTYDFLNEVYSEIAPAYKSSLFHINCDEVRPFDSPEGIAMQDSIGLGGAFAYHINRIDALLSVYDKRLLMWGDMPMLYPEITRQLPQDLIAVIWVYHPVEDYVPYFDTYQNAGMDFMISPGVSSWVRIWPDIDRAVKNIAGFSAQGFEHGAIGSLITTWDDTGDNLFNYNWLPLLWGAECSWNAVREKDNYDQKLNKFKHAFDPLFFGADPETISPFFWQFDSLRYNTVADGFATKVFWAPTSVAKFSPARVDHSSQLDDLLNTTSDLKRALINSKKNALDNGDVIEATIFTIDKIKWLGEMETFESELYRSMNTSNSADWVPTREALLAELDSLKKRFTTLWNLENRPWWLDRIHRKYDKLVSSIEGADKRVYIFHDGDDVFSDSLQIRLACPRPDARIYYTTNGDSASQNALRYDDPFFIHDTTTIHACAYFDDRKGPGTMRQFVKVAENAGLDYHYYEGVWSRIPNFSKLTPLTSGRILTFNHKPKRRQEHFAFQFKGYIHISTPGLYTFSLKSDDGSRLYIDDRQIVDNDGLHRTLEKSGEVELSSGSHKIQVSFFGRGGYENLYVYYSGPDIPRQEIPSAVLFRSP